MTAATVNIALLVILSALCFTSTCAGLFVLALLRRAAPKEVSNGNEEYLG
jgi:hypothetical protein